MAGGVLATEAVWVATVVDGDASADRSKDHAGDGGPELDRGLVASLVGAVAVQPMGARSFGSWPAGRKHVTTGKRARKEAWSAA